MLDRINLVINPNVINANENAGNAKWVSAAENA
jgi:hypothetical protein